MRVFFKNNKSLITTQRALSEDSLFSEATSNAVPDANTIRMRFSGCNKLVERLKLENIDYVDM